MKSRAIYVHATLLVLLAAPAAPPLLGQGVTQGVRGTISDQTGAVVPGAAVRAIDIATGVMTSTVSTGAGLYSITTLNAAAYRVEVEKAGFKRLVRENVAVPLGQIVGLDLTLEVGQTTQTIAVQAAAPLVEKETTELDTSINPKSYLDLPLNASGGRSIETFIALAPGVYSGGGGDSFANTANGGQIFSREVKVDGLDIGNVLAQPGDTSKVLTLPPDAVNEFSYQTLTPPADTGNNMAGTMQYTMRSGTNQIHGSAYEFYVGNVFQSRNPFQGNLSRYNQNEYGFTLGGPVYLPHLYNGKNRTFWFFNFNGYSQRSAPQFHNLTEPTAQEHQGDFSDYPYPIYDPATTALLPSGAYTRTQFPGNIIPANRINSISALIATGIPSPPAGSGLTNNYLEHSIDNTGFKNETFRIDEALSERQRFSFTFNRGHNLTYTCDNPCYNPADTTAANVLGGVQNTGYYDFHHNFDHLNYDLSISPTTLFHITAGLERWSQPFHSDNVGPAWETILGISNTFNGVSFPFIGFGSSSASSNGIATGYESLSSGSGVNDFIGTVPQFSEYFTLVRGRNTFKFGSDNAWYQNEFYGQSKASFTFQGLETGLPGATAATGNPFASFLLGDVDNGSLSISRIATDAVYWDQAAYVMDDIKLTKTLTINAGLRWEVYAPFYDKGNALSVMDPHIPNPGCGGCLGAMIFAGTGPGLAGRRRLSPPIKLDNFEPRLGVAYALKSTLVLRAGFAQVDEMPGIAGSNGNRSFDLGFNGSPTFQSTNSGVTPAFNWSSGFPAYTPPPFLSPTVGNGQGVTIYDGKASHPGVLYQWHFNVQESFRPNWLVDVGYVGSKGTYLYSGANEPNQVNSSYLGLGSLLLDSINSPAVVAAGFTPPYPGFTGSLAQALRPWPQYLAVSEAGSGTLAGAQDGNSTYSSLQVKVQHNFGQGLYLLAAYTWQKWLTDAPGTEGGGGGSVSSQGGFEGVSARDNYHRSLERALGPVPPQQLNVGFNYELPIGRGKPFAGNATGVVEGFLHGWQLNGILTYGAGTPLVVIANDTLPIFNDIQFPNVVSGTPQVLNHNITTPMGPNRQLYLNPAAFSQPAAYTIGNGPATLNVRGFAHYNENLGIMKRFYFAGEKANLELRFETFNAFNRHSYGNNIDYNYNDPSFGSITGVGGGRSAQVAGKIVF